MNKADEVATEEEKPTVDCITEAEFPNLHFLQELKGLFIRQEFEKYELITGFETENRYRLFTDDGNMMLTAKENSGLLRRINLGKYRSMEINVENMNGVEVLRFERDVPMFSCLFPCCFLQTLEVFSGRCFIGSVEKIPSCLNFNFKIRDENGVAIMKIKGPSCFKEFSSCFQNVDFRIFSLETKKEVGYSWELKRKKKLFIFFFYRFVS